MMGYILVKLQVCSVQTTISRLYHGFKKLKNNILEKSLWCTSVLNKLDLLEKRLKTLIYLQENLLGGRFFHFSCKSRVSPNNFV